MWAKIGTDWTSEEGTLVSSGMLAEERYAVSSVMIKDGVRYFMWTINASALPDGHMFYGVAEAADGEVDGQKPCKTWAFNPPTGNLYVGKKLDEHGSEETRKHFFADKDESLLDKSVGAKITMKVDMEVKQLAFSINDSEFIDADVELPAEGVRPWCFLYHEGDSCTLAEVDAAGFGQGGASRPSTAGTDSGIA